MELSVKVPNDETPRPIPSRSPAKPSGSAADVPEAWRAAEASPAAESMLARSKRFRRGRSQFGSNADPAETGGSASPDKENRVRVQMPSTPDVAAPAEEATAGRETLIGAASPIGVNSSKLVDGGDVFGVSEKKEVSSRESAGDAPSALPLSPSQDNSHRSSIAVVGVLHRSDIPFSQKRHYTQGDTPAGAVR